MSDDNATKDANAAVDETKAIGGQDDTQISVEEKEQGKAAEEFKEAKNASDLTMHVRVAAPFHDYYEGQAFSISGINLTGPFDILPKHHNFISLLTACDLVIRGLVDREQKMVKISISGGVIHVKADEVIVFLDV